MQVTGANLVPFTLQKQNLVTAVLSDLLSFASVFSVRLICVEQQTPFPGDDISTASLFVVTQQDTRDLFVGEVSTQSADLQSFASIFCVRTICVKLQTPSLDISAASLSIVTQQHSTGFFVGELTI